MAAERGQPEVRQPARDGPEHGHAAPGLWGARSLHAL
jgi:hypothetical protein